MSECVWHITEGLEDERIDAAIAKTRAFFHSLGVKTRLSEYQIGKEAIPALLKHLEAHGMTRFGEHQDVTLDKNKEIYEASI